MSTKRSIENLKRRVSFYVDVDETLSKVTHEKYELPTTFSEEAQVLVNSTLQKSAELRPTIQGKDESEEKGRNCI